MISILIPFRNEIDSILYYNRTLFPIIDEIMHSFEQEYEYVFVDDGSTDNSSDAVYTMIVASNIKSGKNLKEVDLTRNKFGNGLGNALRYGFTRCKGDYIIVMDADRKSVV
jgi:glycosyltransferase involved in cell wall biosynthesis